MKATDSIGVASGHDAPVFYKSDDQYNRWPVATAISRAIQSSPLAWSTRIGLYGQWGEGKTSVLNFLAKQQAEAGNVVIRYTSWGASSDDEVWRGFSKALRDGLRRARTSIGRSASFAYLARRYAPILASAVKAGGKAVNLKAPGVSIGTDFASELIQKHLKVTKKDVTAMADVLGDRRVIVIIDDLDRADPAVIPKLLLALRDLLDYSRFTFVLAFDKPVIVKALAAYNAAWIGGGEDFLNKIIDFPFELPSPLASQVQRLAEDQFAKLCPFVPVDSLRAISSSLPSNPRKVKLLGRMLAISRSEAERHEIGEINWQIAILFALLRLESEGLASDLLNMSMDMESDESRWLHWALLDKEERERAQADGVSKLVEKHSLSDRKERVEKLVLAWSEAVPSMIGEGLRYHAMFGISPHSLTWGEFKQFLKEWRSDKGPARIGTLVSTMAARSLQADRAVAHEFGESLLGYYAMVLESAANAESGKAHLSLMQEASDCLDLAGQSFIDSGDQLFDREDRLSFWQRLHGIAAKWRHFNANPEEPELRAQETRLLVGFARSLNMPMQIYEVIRPWADPDWIWGERQAQLEADFRAELQAAVEDGAIDAALGFLKTAGQVKQLRSGEKNFGARYLLTSPKSPLFTGVRKKDLLTILLNRLGTSYVVEDGVDYLAMILAAIPHGDQFCRSNEREKFLNEHQDFSVALWNLCVSQPSQFRGLQALRERQKTLVKAGIRGELLAAPDWLEVGADREGR
ncbi:KAP family P-loop NTPase fold protein [Lysobacter tyrosinilyticus]